MRIWAVDIVSCVAVLMPILAVAQENTPSSAAPDDLLGAARIARHPAADDFGRGKLAMPPDGTLHSGEGSEIDLRGYDLSDLDLTERLDDLFDASFDDKTVWPPDERLPRDFHFYRARIMEFGKNPGLGVRALHARGITGQGVGIAIIDQPLLVTHCEYRDQLRLYEERQIRPGTPAQMHGAAVASIAVGKTVGVAPCADLYYIASWTVDWDKGGAGRPPKNFTYYAECVRRVLEINAELPAERKIRVIAMQVGWSPGETGYDDITAAAKEAVDAGLLVVSSSIDETHGFVFHGLGRYPLSDPDGAESYEPGSWWASQFYDGWQPKDRLLAPMDARTTASPTGDSEYVFYRTGGWSWSIPYIAGLYALAAQVDPEITPARFWTTALSTGRAIAVSHGGRDYSLGPIVVPAAMLDALQNASSSPSGQTSSVSGNGVGTVQ